MTDNAKRSTYNPLLHPANVAPSLDGLVVECLLNPGAFTFQGKTWLLLRVAERPEQAKDTVGALVIDPSAHNGLRILSCKKDDPGLEYGTDPRSFIYQGNTYLTTLSHLRLASSEDGVHFQVMPTPTLIGEGELEAFGIEDCRVTQIGNCYYLTYTAVSRLGYGVGMISTEDWQHFNRHGMILPPNNKDCTFFSEKIGEHYFALHRPTLGETGLGGNNIWISKSPDLLHWGEHTCLLTTRPGMWDSVRIGAGAAPTRTEAGWLEIYHGANEQNRYCLGAVLLDLNDPTKVIARSEQPIMEPLAEYEINGFFGNVVFTNGVVENGDTLTVYYGASDLVVCSATFSIKDILATLL
ncbi:glycosidase [Ktedonobacter sp. SOSP1-85]|uniref:glycoside hydrolase family 130 protein n=1 Tax=Ktedonobacter sp. SOSP1-85 TaxID=2778367 RepID=UPI001916AF40|nr:glycoside hydrolase family 130 protein [Ktedonobacter sp. SOSP1-85]GHO81662.1 glycosidase [Ktedonobacter sp. SOSP1-85]